MAQRRIPAITGLRAIAVFLVIFYHSGVTWAPGGMGVLIFFVISGFLITWLMLKENHRNGNVSFGRFYARRSLRIFPAFYCYAILTLFLLFSLHKQINWAQTVASLLYVANYYQAIQGDPGTAFSHTWSLGIEEQFYLCWPIFFVLLRNRPKNLIQITAALIGIVWVYRIVLKYGIHVSQGYFYESFETRMDHLLVGCMLALLLFYHGGHRSWSLVCERPAVTAAVVGLLLLSTMAELRWTNRYRDAWGFIVNAVLCAVLIPQLISLREHWAVKWLDYPAVRYLGTISYSLYLYQQIALEPVRKILWRAPFVFQLIVSIAFLIVIASVSFWFVERPFVRFKDSRFRS